MELKGLSREELLKRIPKESPSNPKSGIDEEKVDIYSSIDNSKFQSPLAEVHDTSYAEPIHGGCATSATDTLSLSG